MKKINAKIKQGTFVKITGIKEVCTVKYIHETKKWIALNEYCGLFQVNDIEKFSNVPNRYAPSDFQTFEEFLMADKKQTVATFKRLKQGNK